MSVPVRGIIPSTRVINGIVDTLDKLHELGIKTAGEGKNYDEANKPALIETCGMKFACFLLHGCRPKNRLGDPSQGRRRVYPRCNGV